MTDDGGVLGNLPRSRPGRRSAKRSEGAAAAARSAPRTAKPRTIRAKPAADARGMAGGSRGERQAPSGERPAHGGGPVGAALRLGGSVVGGGGRAAYGLAREVLRRLPRP